MINSIVRRTLLICSLAIISSRHRVTRKNSEEELVSLNFVNADIQEVIRAISQISKKNFLVDPRVKGTINIVSATPVSPALGYDILLSALRLQGYAAVESAGVTKIIPEADAKLHVDSLAQGRGDKLVTRVFILKYESASQLVNIVRPMIAPNNVVVAYPSSNALVVTDYASSVRRIEKLIDSIDQPNADAPLVIPVKHASAVDLANIINKLMPEATTPQTGGDDNQRFVLVADSRTNGLLLRSDNPGRIARVKELVAKLDSAANVPGNIHVVQLKNTDATKLAQTLRSVMSGDTSALAPAQRQSARHHATDRQQFAPSGGGMIQADIASNSLIITASEPVYNNIRSVIEKLDVRRPQIFVEALIVEVTADKAAEFGVQWQNLTGVNKSGTNIIGGTNFGTFQQHHRRGQQPHLGRPGPEHRRRERNDHAGRRIDTQPRHAGARAGDRHQRQHPVRAQSDDAGQRGSQDRGRPERAVRHRVVCTDRLGHHRHPVPDRRTQGRRPDAEDQAADHAGRHGEVADLSGSIERGRFVGLLH